MSVIAGINGSFPIFSPDGRRLACGSGGLTLYDVTLATGDLTNPRTFPGAYYPNWLTTTRFVFSNGGNGISGRIRFSDPPYTAAADLLPNPLPASSLGAGGGVFAACLLPSTTTIGTASGITTVLSGQKDPSVDTNGRYATSSPNGDAVYVSGSGRIVNENGVLSPRIGTGGVVWSKLTAYVTHGWRAGSIENVSLNASGEFAPMVVDTPSGPWILYLTESGTAPGIYLHPWGNTNKILVTPSLGPNSLGWPTAQYVSGGFLVAWFQPSGASLHTGFVAVNVLDPLYAIGSGTPSGGGPSGTTPTAPHITPTAKNADATKLAAARAPKVSYPHVSQVEDPHTQKALRILFDRVFQAEHAIATAIPAQIKTVSDTVTANQAAQTLKLQQLSVASTGTTIAVGSPTPGGGGSGSSGGGGSGGGGGGGGGQSADCAGVSGTGHIPAGELTFDRASQIVCGTGNEWNSLTSPVPDLATRTANAAELVQRMIWHLALGGFTAGRQKNPSGAISSDKLAVVILSETRAFDVFRSFDSYDKQMVVQMLEVFPANLIADPGISD